MTSGAGPGAASEAESAAASEEGPGAAPAPFPPDPSPGSPGDRMRGPRVGWAFLARWMRVPEKPPALPPGRHAWARSFRPSPSYLRYLRAVHILTWGMIGIFLALLMSGVVIGVRADGAPPLIVGGLVVLLVVPAVLWFLFGYWAVALRFDTTWYVMTDRALRVRTGIWTIREVTVTFENAQNVRVKRGPLQRLLGIGDVAVETAATGVPGQAQGTTTASGAVIAGVDDPQAIRDRIIERMRMSRASGLGDEGERGSGGRAGPARFSHPQWSPAHLGLLREIRDELGAIS